MLGLILSLVLSLAPQETPAPPSAERVAQVIEDLERALKQGTEEQQVRLLVQAGEVPSKRVAQVLAKRLKDKRPKLVDAALQGLRWMQHPEALKALHKAHSSNKAILRNESQHLALLRAIGQHADVSSIKLLSRGIFDLKQAKLVEARIFGLGMIRHGDAVEALFAVMNGNLPRKVQKSMGSLRVSLMMLTGVDKGPKLEAWLKWWREHEKGFKIGPRSPAIPRKIVNRWTRYWGLDYETQRLTKREDRGL